MKNIFIKSRIYRAKKIIGTTLFLAICSSSLALFNISQANAQSLGQSLEQIRIKSEQAEAQVDKQLREVKIKYNNPQARAQLEQQKIKLKKQFIYLLNDEEKYKQALENPSVTQKQKELLRLFKSNPQEIDKFIDQQSDPEYLAEQPKLQIRKIRQEAEKRVKQRALNSVLRKQ